MTAGTANETPITLNAYKNTKKQLLLSPSVVHRAEHGSRTSCSPADNRSDAAVLILNQRQTPPPTPMWHRFYGPTATGPALFCPPPSPPSPPSLRCCGHPPGPPRQSEVAAGALSALAENGRLFVDSREENTELVYEKAQPLHLSS